MDHDELMARLNAAGRQAHALADALEAQNKEFARQYYKPPKADPTWFLWAIVPGYLLIHYVFWAGLLKVWMFFEGR